MAVGSRSAACLHALSTAEALSEGKTTAEAVDDQGEAEGVGNAKGAGPPLEESCPVFR